VSTAKTISKNLDKTSLSNTNKDIAIRTNVSMFDVDDSAMDIDLAKCDIIMKNQSEELNEQRPVADQSIIRSKINDSKINEKSSEDINEEETEDIELIYNEENTNDMNKTKDSPPKTVIPIICHKTPRRVKLITLSSPKETKKQ
jgi:hypothetical protein